MRLLVQLESTTTCQTTLFVGLWPSGLALPYGSNIFNYDIFQYQEKIYSPLKKRKHLLKDRHFTQKKMAGSSPPCHRTGIIDPKLSGSRPTSQVIVSEMYTPRRTSFLGMSILDPVPRPRRPGFLETMVRPSSGNQL
jgi:hypothetical protein